jgi:high-affinity iron transporter
VLHTLLGYADQPSVLQVMVYTITLVAIFALTKAMAPRARILPAGAAAAR